MIVGALEPVAATTADAGVTYAAALVPTPDGLSTGMCVKLSFGTPNATTTPTVNLNVFGAKTVTLGDGATAPLIGQLSGVCELCYDGAVFRLLTPFGVSLAIGLPVKTSIVTADSFVILDSAASNAAKTETAANVFPQNLAAKGHYTLPGGLLINWGTSGVIGSGATEAETFDLAFTTAVWSVLMSTYNHTPASPADTSYLDTVGLSGFTIHNQSTAGGNSSFYWVALGK